MVAPSKTWLIRTYENLTQRSWTPLSKVEVNARTGMAIADAFEQAIHAPHCTKTQAAYRAFCTETETQFTALLEAGVTMVPWRGAGQPYANSDKMFDDVNRRRIAFFPTASGHGELADNLDQSINPLLQNCGFEIEGVPVCFNDLFRVVHDVFGHALEESNFGPTGEENAWRSHRRMFSKLAVAAMTTETRGQNSWVNFGPHMRSQVSGKLLRKGDQGWLPLPNRPYAAQKMLLLPERFRRIEVAD